MFDMFLKPKYYTKCKSCLKLLKSRLDAIRKKKNAVLKYLKSDIVELLKSRLDYNAYNRAEGFLVERNVLRCYELIDEFCGTISNQLSVLIKQSECPDECNEAVASLIYAAARFADLPELRELRNFFTGKYGCSFEPFTSIELIEKSRATIQSKEIKLQLLQEIAQESAIDWNSKALEQQLYIPPPNEPDVVPVHGRKKSSVGKRDSSDDESMFDIRSEGNTTETSTVDSSTDQDVRKGGSEDEVEDQTPFYLRVIRPPYLKTKPTNKETMEEARKATDQVENDERKKQQPEPTLEEKPKPKSVRRRNVKLQPTMEIKIDNVGNSGNDMSSSRNKGKEAMKGEGDDDEEEEKMLDGLLMHYSKKKPSHESNEVRAVSLSIDSTEPTELTELENKHHIRTNSFVHPKLPDYDELAARFAALKEDK